MAILWQRNIEGNLYEVRMAGASMRLYRNGVHHSQWNPNRPLSGSIWDLFVLPAMHRKQGEVKDALVLGFGAGAAGKLLHELVEPERVVGIELDDVHLSIADGFFECTDGCELVAGDAVEWVQDQRGGSEQFDLIIDDLYGEEDGVPLRYAPLDLDWFNALTEILSPEGILILNLLEPSKIPHLPPMKNAALKKRLPHHLIYQIDGYENRILALSQQPFDGEYFDSRLKEILRSYPASRGVAKRYKVSTI